MINTVVCTKQGCCGNKFHVNTEENNIIIACTECGTIHEHFDISDKNFKVAPSCSKCNSEVFKVFKDTLEDKVWFQCIECNSIPRYIYFDDAGNQINYEQLTILEMHRSMKNLESKVNNVIDELSIIKDNLYDLE